MSRILVLCYEYPPLGGGGGRVAAHVASALVAREHEVCFVTGGLPFLPSRSMIDGVRVIRVHARRRRADTCSIFEMCCWVIASLPVVLGEAFSWKPHVIHAHFAVPTGIVAWIVHQLTRIPYVLTVHLGDVPGGVPEQTDHFFKILKPFTIPIWRSAAYVTAVSSFVADLASKAYNIQPKIILNGIPALLHPHQSFSQTPRLLMVGRLSIQKNPILAIQALALVRELSWTLQIVGEGPLLLETKDCVKRLGLEDQVSFLGWLSVREVQKTMEKSDILLIPSLSEGLPMVGVEALAHGLAIVGSRIGGLRDIINEHHNGVFFNLDHGAVAMAQALRPLLENALLRTQMKNASLHKAKNFHWSHSIDAYESILEATKRDH